MPPTLDDLDARLRVIQALVEHVEQSCLYLEQRIETVAAQVSQLSELMREVLSKAS